MKTSPASFRIPFDRRADIRELVNTVKDNPELNARALEYVRSVSKSNSGPARKKGRFGVFRNEKVALQTLTRSLAIALRPDAIFLFGSRARGDERPDSDFDLMVVTPDDLRLDYLTAAQPIAGLGVSTDVVPCRYSPFIKNREVPGMLCHTVEQEGRLLDARIGGPFWERYLAMFPKHRLKNSSVISPLTLGFLKVAEKDIGGMAHVMLDYPDHAAFLAQQAAEKLARAVCLHEGLPDLRSHDIFKIAERLSEENFLREKFLELNVLTPAVTPQLYPKTESELPASPKPKFLQDILSQLKLVRAAVLDWMGAS